MIAFSGFAPDADPTTPGVITDCLNIVPSVRGMIAAGGGESIGLSAIGEECLDAASLRKLDDTARFFVGTPTKIYENASSTWLDRSKGGGYTNTATSWSFAQFGDITIATNYVDAVQYSSSTTFADLTGTGTPPKAKIVEVAAGFVLLFNYNDGTNIFQDGWWCSGLYDHTKWTPSAATQAANGRLFQSPGPITAAKRFGDGVVVYKDGSMYLGSYIGPPIIWAFQQVAQDTGAYCQNAVVSVAGVHYFLGRNGLFMYDGSRPVPIGAGTVREWLRSNININYVSNIVSAYDPKTSIIYWAIPSNSSGGDCDEILAYNTVTGNFGRITKAVKALVDLKLPPKTWGDYATLASGTWEGLGDILTYWNSPLLAGANIGLSFVGDDEIVYKLESTPVYSRIVTGAFGDDEQMTTIKRVRPRFLDDPDQGTMEYYHKRTLGTDWTFGGLAALNDGKFDILYSDRWHRVFFNFVGNCEITGFDVDLRPSGKR